MGVPWLVLKQVVEGAVGARRVMDMLCDVRLADTLTAIGDNHAMTAARALREAATRDGEAARMKLETARHALEGAYTAYSRLGTGDSFRERLYRRTHRAKVNTGYAVCCQISLVTAAVYRALGHDDQSVADFLRRARQMGDRYRGGYRDFRHSEVVVPGQTVRHAVCTETFSSSTGIRVLHHFEERPKVEQVSHPIWREVIAEVEQMVTDGRPSAAGAVLDRVTGIGSRSPLREAG